MSTIAAMSSQMTVRLDARSSRRARSLLTVAALGFAVASCSDAATQDDTTRDDGGEVVEGGEVGTLSLKVGDCLAEEAEGEIESVPVVPCSEPHDSELFHSFEIPGDDFPGVDEVQTIAVDTCTEEFESFIGVSYEDSVWDITAVYPTEETWDQIDDREIICGVFPISDEDTTGSARGIAE